MKGRVMKNTKKFEKLIQKALQCAEQACDKLEQLAYRADEPLARQADKVRRTKGLSLLVSIKKLKS